jgi:hypothetical protein
LKCEVGVGCAQYNNKMILEGLDGLIGGVDAVVVRFDKLKSDLLGCKVGLDYFCGLIVHDV